MPIGQLVRSSELVAVPNCMAHGIYFHFVVISLATSLGGILVESVLVTGGAGMLGKAVTARLVASGYHVVCLDLPEQLDRGYAGPKLSQVDLVPGSVLDESLMADLIAGANSVIHLAGFLGVAKTEEEPTSCLRINLEGTQRLVSNVQRSNVRRLIYASSSEVYGNASHQPISEEAPVSPNNVYAASKLAAEYYVLGCKSNASDFPGVVLRLFNTYGPHQRHDFVIPRFMSAIQSGMPVPLNGDGSQIRSFLFVDDCADGFLSVLNSKGPLTSPLNLGNGQEPTSMRHLVDLIGEVSGIAPILTGFDGETFSDRAPNREIWSRICDSTAIQSATGWEPSTSLRDGLWKTWSHLNRKNGHS